jgi:hypothetical protein
MKVAHQKKAIPKAHRSTISWKIGDSLKQPNASFVCSKCRTLVLTAEDFCSHGQANK